MKKIINSCLFVFMFFMSISIVNAYELECDTGLYNFQDYFLCHISGNPNENLSSLSGRIENNELVSCVTYNFDEGLQQLDSSDPKYLSFSGTPKNANYINLKCQVIAKVEEQKQTQIVIPDFQYQTSDGTSEVLILRSNEVTLNKYTETTTTKKKDDKNRDTSNPNSRLKELKGDNLDITFSQFVTEYSFEVLYEVEKLDILALPLNDQASVRIVGNDKLKVGDNTVDIYVTSPDGKMQTVYSLYVKRLARGEDIYYPENDASLFSLSVPGYSIKFESVIHEYHIHLPNNVNSLEINATPTFEDATISVSNTNNLVNGSIITVTVTSADETKTQKYTIKITKDPEKKDYTSYYILGAFVLIIIVFMILFIKTAKKNKNDPILSSKKLNTKKNKGAKFDINSVPVSDPSSVLMPSPEEPATSPVPMPEPNTPTQNPVPMPAPEQNTEKNNDIEYF